MTKIFSQDNKCPGRNSNSASSECKPDELQLEAILLCLLVAFGENVNWKMLKSRCVTHPSMWEDAD
jgi:hypothetical protein